MGKGISLFRNISGTASAIMYLINMLITSLTAFLASFINIQNSLVFIFYLCHFIITVPVGLLEFTGADA